MARPPRPPPCINAPELALCVWPANSAVYKTLMKSGTRTFNDNDKYIFTTAKGKEEVLPWNGHSPKGRRSGGKWGGLKSIYG